MNCINQVTRNKIELFSYHFNRKKILSKRILLIFFLLIDFFYNQLVGKTYIAHKKSKKSLLSRKNPASTSLAGLVVYMELFLRFVAELLGGRHQVLEACGRLRLAAGLESGTANLESNHVGIHGVNIAHDVAEPAGKEGTHHLGRPKALSVPDLRTGKLQFVLLCRGAPHRHRF